MKVHFAKGSIDEPEIFNTFDWPCVPRQGEIITLIGADGEDHNWAVTAVAYVPGNGGTLSAHLIMEKRRGYTLRNM